MDIPGFTPVRLSFGLGVMKTFVFRTISFFSFLSIFLSSNLLLAIYSVIRPLVYPQPPPFFVERVTRKRRESPLPILHTS